MSTIGSLVVVLEANIARFQTNMNRAAQGTETAMNKMRGAANLVTAAVGMIGVGLSVDALVGMANEAIDALATLDDMAQKTGASVEQLSQLSKVAAATGTEFGTVDAALVKLSKGMVSVDDEGSKVRKAMQALGMSTKDLKSQDPSSVFIEVARRLQDYEDGAEKAALMTDLLGKSGAQLMPYMNDVSEYLTRFKGDTAASAAAASAYQDELGFMKVRFQELKTTITVATLPAMTDFVTALSDTMKGSKDVAGIDVASWADNTAVGMARVVDVGVLLVRVLSAVATAAQVAVGNVKLVVSAAPVVIAYKLATGGAPFADLKQQWAEQSDLIGQEFKQFGELWTVPANTMEQAVLTRLAARTKDGDSKDDKPDPKKPLGYSSDGNAEAGAAQAKKGLDMRLKALEDGMAKELGALEFGNKYIAELRNQDLIDLDAYNDYQQKALDSGLAITLKAYDAEIAQLRAHQAKVKKATERDEDQLAINTLQAKKAKASQDAEQDGLMLKLSLSRAQSDLNKMIEDWGRQQTQANNQLEFENTLLGKSTLEVAKLTAQRRIELDIEEKIRQAREKGSISDASVEQFRQDGKAQVTQVNKAATQSVGKQIGESMRTPGQVESEQYANRIKDLQAFRDAELENTVEGNRLIEEENRRHEEAMANMKAQSAQAMLGLAQSSADSLYSALQAAGLEQTALGKAMFFAQKAIQVATIIVNTEVAAAAAQAGMIAAAGATAAVSGPAGPAILVAGIAAGAAYATATRVMGYATAGLVAGTALAGAREKGGPVWSGGAFLVGERGPEIFQPSGHGTIIPNSSIGGGKGGGDFKLSLINNGTPQRVVEHRQIAPDEWALIVEDAKNATAASLADPNSVTSRSMHRNFGVQRSRV